HPSCLRGRRPPRRTPLPYTTPFRSRVVVGDHGDRARGGAGVVVGDHLADQRLELVSARIETAPADEIARFALDDRGRFHPLPRRSGGTTPPSPDVMQLASRSHCRTWPRPALIPPRECG